MQIEKIEIEKLTSDPANARQHNPRNLAAIKGSLTRFGQQKPIVVDAAGVVRAGNGTLQAAKALGWDSIAIVRTELEGSDAVAYAIADNRTAELARWENETLASLLNSFDDELIEASGFESDEVEALLEELSPMLPVEIVEQEAPRLPADPVTEPGDIWQLGNHLLLCGDCRKKQDVEKLFIGEKASLAFTSPPYASQRTYDKQSEFEQIAPNDFCKWFEPVQQNVAAFLSKSGSWFLNIKEHCEDGQRVLYVKDLTLQHVRKWNWRLVDEFCWERTGLPGMYPNRFKNGWEPVFHFCKNKQIKFAPENVLQDFDATGASTCDEVRASGRSSGYTEAGSGGGPGFVKSKNHEGALPSNVLRISGVEKGVNHPAMFPVALPAFFIKAYSDKGGVVFDPFLGSGTTLIAADQLGRKCYGVEISPAYCDVIVQRWEKLTGGKGSRK